MTSATKPSARERVEEVAKVIRRIIGAPDYERYLAHVQKHHPDRTPMTRDEFMQQCMIDKYNRPGTRCC